MRPIALLSLALIACEAEPTAISGMDDAMLEQAPAPQTATVYTSNAAPGSDIYVQVRGGAANDAAYTVYGNSGGTTCPPPLGGECFDVTGAGLMGIVSTDSSGNGIFSLPVPFGYPTGTLTNVQALGLGGGSAWATTLRPLAMGTGSMCPGQTNAIANPSIELGTYGVWDWSGAPIISNDAYEGGNSLEHEGNFYVEQTFADVPVADLTNASFATYHDPTDSPLMSVNWTYSDGSSGSWLVFQQDLMGWQEHDVLPQLDQTKSLRSFRAWGYSGGGPAPDITRFDAFAFCH